MKAIIQAHRTGAYVIVIYPIINNPVEAKRNIRKFGPINNTKYIKDNKTTLFGYINERERLRVSQYVNKKITGVRKDTEKHSPRTISDRRQREIESEIVGAYNKKAQFIITYPNTYSEHQAEEMLKYFGKGKVITNNQNQKQYVVDDVLNQIQAIINL